MTGRVVVARVLLNTVRFAFPMFVEFNIVMFNLVFPVELVHLKVTLEAFPAIIVTFCTIVPVRLMTLVEFVGLMTTVVLNPEANNPVTMTTAKKIKIYKKLLLFFIYATPRCSLYS